MEEALQIRIHEAASLRPSSAAPTLIYLPGLHGDWTLAASFRKALSGRARFVEITYPRSLSWSLHNYAAEIETALAHQGIATGWLLAESYGSQVGWEIIRRNQFRSQGLILAGGFVRYPLLPGVRAVACVARRFSIPLMKPLLRLYAALFRLRYRSSPEVLAQMTEFLSRRTELDLRAAIHRLDLIAKNNPSPIAGACHLPVYSLTGSFDPIVPWIPVRRWLAKNCPGLREQKIIWRADHVVLASAPRAAADQVLKWVGVTQT